MGVRGCKRSPMRFSPEDFIKLQNDNAEFSVTLIYNKWFHIFNNSRCGTSCCWELIFQSSWFLPGLQVMMTQTQSNMGRDVYGGPRNGQMNT